MGFKRGFLLGDWWSIDGRTGPTITVTLRLTNRPHFRRQSTKEARGVKVCLAFSGYRAYPPLPLLLIGHRRSAPTLEVKTRSPSMKADSARVFNPAILAAITKRIVRIISQHLSIGVSTTKRSRPLACDLFSLRNRGRVTRQRVARGPWSGHIVTHK